MSVSLTDYQIDAIVSNDNTKYYTLFFGKGGIIAVMVKAKGSERGNARSFIRTLPLGDRNDWLLKEMLD